MWDQVVHHSSSIAQILLGNILAVTVVILLAAVLYVTRARHVKGLPVPVGIPFFGSAFAFARHFHEVYDFMNRLALQAGDGKNWTTGMCFAPRNLSCVFLGADPAMTEHVLKTHFTKYGKGTEMREVFQELLGDGIFNSEGAQWREQRKTASHMFSLKNLRNDMSVVFLKNGHTVLSRLHTKMAQQQSIDIQDLFFRYTLDSFSEIAFGEMPGCLSSDDVPFARAFDACQQACNDRMYDPAWYVKRRLHIGSERKFRKNLLFLNSYAQEVIKHRRHSQLAAEKPDLLSRFIIHAQENGEELSDSYLRDLVLNFIIAGRDTTAIVMSWAVYELTQHPEVEQKIVEEVQRLYANGLPGSHEDVVHLPYLEAVIYETLRLHPSVPIDIKQALEDDTLPDGTKVVEGTLIVYTPYIFGRSPRLWGPDAAEFRPERWLEEESPSQYKFIAFNAGPRLCLGKQVALMESCLLLSMILSKFKLSLAKPDEPVTYVPSLTMQIKGGLRVNVAPRV